MEINETSFEINPSQSYKNLSGILVFKTFGYQPKNKILYFKVIIFS
jgi:hypothetical protein